MLSRIYILVNLMLVLCFSAHSQHFAKKDFDAVNAAVAKAVTKTALMQQLNTLLKNYMPSNSGIGTPLNRPLHGEVHHQRIAIRFYPNNFFINLLTRNDSILLSAVCFTESAFSKGPAFLEADSTVKAIHYNAAAMKTFLESRNNFYHAQKTVYDVAVEISFNKIYAMNCGARTEEGKYITALIATPDPLPKILVMLQSMCCEVQAFGVTAIDLLSKKGGTIDTLNSKLYKYIRERNAPVVTCSGSYIGEVKKLY